MSRFLRQFRSVMLGAICASLTQAATPNRAPRELPGQRADGSVLLPNQWSLRPAGRQVALGDFPVQVAIHPGGEFAAVLHCGYGPHEVVVVDIARAKVVTRVTLDEAFYGLAFDPKGERLFCSGAGEEVVHSFAFKDGTLSDHRQIRLRPTAERGVPGGLAVAADGSRLWVANVWGQCCSEVTLGPTPSSRDLLLGETPAGAEHLIAPPIQPDLAAATKRQEATLDPASPDAPFPYACVLDAARQRLYVSLWAKAQVAVLDLRTSAVTALWRTEEHPNEMVLSPDGRRLFVANANRNTVSVLAADDGRVLETLSTALHPQSPPGSTPNSLALTPDGTRLFVANACNNNVAVFDVSTPGRSRALGFIPVGWYPTSVRVTPDGKRLLVANGKGLMPKSNRHGPRPGAEEPPASVREYIGGLLRGRLSLIDLPSADQFETRLKAWSAQAYACSPPPAATPLTKPGARHPIPAQVGDPSPIKYCLYILKENRTYDQMLGDMPEGNGDPSLCLFPESVTPNHHALACEFVLLDNFYVESEVSADGHEWSMAAYATDFVEKSWPLNYGHNRFGKVPYPSEGKFPVATPVSGYLWDSARAAGVSYRSYGEFVDNGRTIDAPATTRVAALQGHFDPAFHGWDLDYPDAKRADRFIAELHRYEREGGLPRLQILRLPNDHTYGTATGKLTPRAMVADNDLALGRVVEAVSRSKFWAQTAIFVVEDDAQNGSDHVDAHRTIAYVLSPYVRRDTVDSTLYSTCSLLRTMELILGLRPMTQFDAAARPMFAAFQAKPNLRPYRARPVTVDLKEKNGHLAWGRRLSDQMDFSREDAADDLRLNEVIWRSVKGADAPMPAPVRAAFVLAQKADEDDD